MNNFTMETIRERLREAEETIRAIRLGEADAVVVKGPDGQNRVYTLVTADQSYRTLVEQMREVALTLSHSGVILYSNSRLESLLGLARGVTTGQRLADLVRVEDRGLVQDMVARSSDDDAAAEIGLLRGDDTVVPFHISMSSLKSEGLSGICVVGTDLTEQKRRDLAAADQRVANAILEYAGAAILLCDEAGNILLGNRMAMNLCGDVIGRSFDDLFEAEARYDELIRGAVGEESECKLECGDGTHRVLLASLRPVPELLPSSGPRWVATLHDITERKQIEAERVHLLHAEREARALAEDASRTKSYFLASMSHEFRTPLTAVVGYSGLLENEVSGPLTESQIEYVNRIKACAWHLVGVVDEILTYSKMEAGQEGTFAQEVDLVELVRQSTAMLEPEANRKGVQLQTSLPTEPLTLMTDPGKVRQILVNLIGNAIKFTDEGRVDVQLGTDGENAELRVQDTGPGIPREQLDRIFQPFTQVDQSTTRPKGGAGLGLSLSRHLAQMLGGDIGVESELGSGSTFTFTVPQVLETHVG